MSGAATQGNCRLKDRLEAARELREAVLVRFRAYTALLGREHRILRIVAVMADAEMGE